MKIIFIFLLLLNQTFQADIKPNVMTVITPTLNPHIKWDQKKNFVLNNENGVEILKINGLCDENFIQFQFSISYGYRFQ